MTHSAAAAPTTTSSTDSSAISIDWPEECCKTLTVGYLELLPMIEQTVISQWLTQERGNQAFKKGSSLKMSDRVMTCSLLIKEQEYYFTFICRAAMKKKVHYQLCLLSLLLSLTIKLRLSS